MRIQNCDYTKHVKHVAIINTYRLLNWVLYVS